MKRTYLKLCHEKQRKKNPGPNGLIILNTSGTGLMIKYINYASPSSGYSYCDRQLTLNFDLWAEFFGCRHVSIWGFRNRVCLSVPRENELSYLRRYQSYSSNWYINGKVLTNTTACSLKLSLNLNWISLKKKHCYITYLSVSAVMFCNIFLAYTVYIDRSTFSCYP